MKNIMRSFSILFLLNIVIAGQAFSTDTCSQSPEQKYKREQLKEMVESKVPYNFPESLQTWQSIYNAPVITEDLFDSIDIDALSTEKKNELLLDSCYLGFTRLAERLLNYPDINPATKEYNWDKGNAPLCNAAIFGHADIVRLLLTFEQVDPAVNNNQPILEAASAFWKKEGGPSEESYNQIVEMLMARPEVDPSVNNDEAIREAAKDGRLDTVKLLLRNKKVDPAAGNNSPLLNAAWNSHTETVAFLIKQEGVDPTVYNNAIVESSFQENCARKENRCREVLNVLLADNRVVKALTKNQRITIATTYPDINIGEESTPKPQNKVGMRALSATCWIFGSEEHAEEMSQNFANLNLANKAGAIVKIYVSNTLWDFPVALFITNNAYFSIELMTDATFTPSLETSDEDTKGELTIDAFEPKEDSLTFTVSKKVVKVTNSRNDWVVCKY